MSILGNAFKDDFKSPFDNASVSSDFDADFQKAFKATNVSTYTPVPPGVYAIKIDNAAVAENKTGTGRHVSITASILAKIEKDGTSEKCVRKYAGRKIFEHWTHDFDDKSSEENQYVMRKAYRNLRKLWLVTGHSADSKLSNASDLIGLIAYAFIYVKENRNGYPPRNAIKTASFERIPDYMRRRLQADTFIDRQIDILKDILKIDFRVSPQYSDTQEVTDLIGRTAAGLEVRVSLRTDTNESHRVNGIFRLRESEIPKIENGHGDYMLVCYVKGDEILDWKLLDLKVLHNIARGNVGGLRRLGELHSNNDGSYYTFCAMDINPTFIVAESSAPQSASPFSMTAAGDPQPWMM